MPRLDVGVADAGQRMVDAGRLDKVVVGRPRQAAHEAVARAACRVSSALPHIADPTVAPVPGSTSGNAWAAP